MNTYTKTIETLKEKIDQLNDEYMKNNDVELFWEINRLEIELLELEKKSAIAIAETISKAEKRAVKIAIKLTLEAMKNSRHNHQEINDDVMEILNDVDDMLELVVEYENDRDTAMDSIAECAGSTIEQIQQRPYDYSFTAHNVKELEDKSEDVGKPDFLWGLFLYVEDYYTDALNTFIEILTDIKDDIQSEEIFNEKLVEELEEIIERLEY